ncbi:hypothetical protein [Rhizobium leguminosarum]|uniref:hypothetical protein n=1 Tax=Rhizobium leguminosarum TaxID=384 RepID=UPI001030D2C0|nr:hypothetical protein [Rhizobium leguminosarum]TBH09920.1 hypothetical protein ELG68_01420 [Rhizobium leguminosarum]
MTDKPSPQTKWNSEHPLEMLAHQYVRSALKRGLLERQPCEVCGEAETDAHHDDYDQPRKVRWLCRRHHQQHHAERRKA